MRQSTCSVAIIRVLIASVLLPAKIVSSTNDEQHKVVGGEFDDKFPKLRILIACDDSPFLNSHFQLHRAIAECLADDHESVEKVVCRFITS